MKVIKKIAIIAMSLFITTSTAFADIDISSLSSVQKALKGNPSHGDVYSAWVKSSNLEPKGQKATTSQQKEANAKRTEITRTLKKWLDARK